MLETVVKRAAEPFGINIAAILAIVEAVMAMFENCSGERRTLAQRMKNPGFLGRVRLRRELRKVLESEDCCRPLRTQVNALADALEAQAKSMTVEDCQACVQEVFGADDSDVES